jgi:hypothetical protein
MAALSDFTRSSRGSAFVKGGPSCRQKKSSVSSHLNPYSRSNTYPNAEVPAPEVPSIWIICCSLIYHFPPTIYARSNSSPRAHHTVISFVRLPSHLSPCYNQAGTS